MNPDIDAIEAARRLVAKELAPPSRIAHGALLGIAVATTVMILSLLLTEPALPGRTIAAFTALAVIGTAWSGYALWALSRRHVLYGRQRVVAGWIALAAATTFSLGAFSVGLWAAKPAGLVAGASGLPIIAGAALLLSHARRRTSELKGRLIDLR